MNNKIPVFVGAIGGGGHGEQIVKALKLSEPGRYFIIGGDCSRYCPQFQLVDFPVITPKANDPSFIEAITKICTEFGVRAVFHGCEPELQVLSKNRKIFEDKGILLPINPEHVINTCMDKIETSNFLNENNFFPPAYTIFKDSSAIDRIERYPVIVKPYKGGGGSRETYIAQSPKELRLLSEYLDFENNSFIAQEYVGSFTEEYTVGVLHDLNGKLINSIAIRRLMNGALNMRLAVKNKTSRKELGDWLVVSSGVSHGEVKDFSKIREKCEEISTKIGASGPINIQCRLAEGKVRVFEINPRFSGTTSLRAMFGYNEPDLLLRKHLLGEEIEPRFSYGSGCIIRSLKENILPEKEPRSWKEL